MLENQVKNVEILLWLLTHLFYLYMLLDHHFIYFGFFGGLINDFYFFSVGEGEWNNSICNTVSNFCNLAAAADVSEKSSKNSDEAGCCRRLLMTTFFKICKSKLQTCTKYGRSDL
jgi:hypothetical protein